MQSASADVVTKLRSKSEVIQLYRYPGLSESAAHTLLRRVGDGQKPLLVLHGDC